MSLSCERLKVESPFLSASLLITASRAALATVSLHWFILHFLS